MSRSYSFQDPISNNRLKDCAALVTQKDGTVRGCFLPSLPKSPYCQVHIRPPAPSAKKWLQRAAQASHINETDVYHAH